MLVCATYFLKSYVAIEMIRPHVATKILCHDRAWGGAAEARSDRAPWTRDRVSDRTHSVHDKLDTVHCVGHCLGIVHGQCSLILFMGTVKKKEKKNEMTLVNWGVTLIF